VIKAKEQQGDTAISHSLSRALKKRDTQPPALMTNNNIVLVVDTFSNLL